MWFILRAQVSLLLRSNQDLKVLGLSAIPVRYNDKRNLLSLIWLAEALGENGNKLKKTVEAVMAFNSMPERCEAFRRAIPIDRIKELVDNPKGWRIDLALKTYIDFSDEQKGCKVGEESPKQTNVDSPTLF